MPPAVGKPLPAFALTSAVSHVVVDNAWLAGRKAVLVVHGSKSTEAAKSVSKALRETEPDAAKVAYASIVDLRPFSGLWKKVAEAQLKSSYAKLAEKATAAGLDAAVHVILCPDWDGAVCKAFDVLEPDKAPVAIVTGKGGVVIGVFAGPGMAESVIAALASS